MSDPRKVCYLLEVQHPNTGEWVDAEAAPFSSLTEAYLFAAAVYPELNARGRLEKS